MSDIDKAISVFGSLAEMAGESLENASNLKDVVSITMTDVNDGIITKEMESGKIINFRKTTVNNKIFVGVAAAVIGIGMIGGGIALYNRNKKKKLELELKKENESNSKIIDIELEEKNKIKKVERKTRPKKEKGDIKVEAEFEEIEKDEKLEKVLEEVKNDKEIKELLKGTTKEVDADAIRTTDLQNPDEEPFTNPYAAIEKERTNNEYDRIKAFAEEDIKEEESNEIDFDILEISNVDKFLLSLKTYSYKDFNPLGLEEADLSLIGKVSSQDDFDNMDEEEKEKYREIIDFQIITGSLNYKVLRLSFIQSKEELVEMYELLKEL